MLMGNITRLHLKVGTVFHIYFFIKCPLNLVNCEILVKNHEQAGDCFFFVFGGNYCLSLLHAVLFFHSDTGLESIIYVDCQAW